MLNFKLPVYEIRAFESKFEEDACIIIETIYNRYILDDKKLVGNFIDRRIQLVEKRDELKYKLYPLSKKITTLSQLLKSKAKRFITENGEIVKHVKQKFYNVECYRVASCTQIFNGKYQLYVNGINTPFITKDSYSFISLIKVNKSYLIIDLYKVRPVKPKTRIKI